MKAHLPTMEAANGPVEMDEDELVSILQSCEDDSKSFVHGSLARAREQATAEYYSIPEDAEDNGLSTFVTSDTQDTIEWVLPTIMKMFTGGEKAVEFEPRMPEDEEGAQQATEGCNYVFYRANNGFLVLHTAIKDALMLRNGAITWRFEEKRVRDKERYRGVTLEELAYTLDRLDGEAEITAADQVSADVMDQSGQVVQPAQYDVQVSVVRKRGRIRLDNIPPEMLLIHRDWTSPLLAECPYVCHLVPATLSELRQMGYDVEAEHLLNDQETSEDADLRATISGDQSNRTERTDEAMQQGILRREWVLVDFDGDGIAERRFVARLGSKILENEECSHVPVACGVPILRQHRWDGLSLADAVADIQRLNTEVVRMILNSLYFSVTPRNRVLTDMVGNPLANVDDMLNFTPGSYVREKQTGAVQPMETNFVGLQAMPILEFIGKMRQDRTGVNQYFQGNSTDALNKTASGTAMLTQQTQQRVELIARMLAETLVVPTFQGILKLLIEFQMEPLAFRLNNKFVRMDPQEWRDQYDMTINVGLGTGNKDQMLMHLSRIQAAQLQMLQLGIAGQNGPMVTPKNLHAVVEKMARNMGFEAPEQFVNDPGEALPPQPSAPPPEIVKTQMTLQSKAQEQQVDLQAQAQRFAAEKDFEARRILQEQQHEKEMEALRADLDAARAESAEVSGMRKAEHQQRLSDESESRRGREARDGEIRQLLMEQRPELAADIAGGAEVETIESKIDAHGEALSQLLADKAAPVSIQIQKDAKGKVIGAVATRGGARTEINIQR